MDNILVTAEYIQTVIKNTIDTNIANTTIVKFNNYIDTKEDTMEFIKNKEGVIFINRSISINIIRYAAISLIWNSNIFQFEESNNIYNVQVV